MSQFSKNCKLKNAQVASIQILHAFWDLISLLVENINSLLSSFGIDSIVGVAFVSVITFQALTTCIKLKTNKEIKFNICSFKLTFQLA